MKSTLFVYSPLRPVSLEGFQHGLSQLKQMLKLGSRSPFKVEESFKDRSIGVKIENKHWKQHDTTGLENRLWNLKFAVFRLEKVVTAYYDAKLPSAVQLSKDETTWLKLDFSDTSGGLPVNQLFLPDKSTIVVSVMLTSAKRIPKHRDKLETILDEIERKVMLTDIITNLALSRWDDVSFLNAIRRAYAAVELIKKKNGAL